MVHPIAKPSATPSRIPSRVVSLDDRKTRLVEYLTAPKPTQKDLLRVLLSEITDRKGTLARTGMTDLGHFRHSPNAFWLTPSTPFWSDAVARLGEAVVHSGQTHLEQFALGYRAQVAPTQVTNCNCQSCIG